MQIHQVKRVHPNKTKKIVGRGGKRGTTAGRGTKGQLARSGRKLRPELRDLIKKIPKLRGYRFASVNNTKPISIKLEDIAKIFKEGGVVSLSTLLSSSLLSTKKGRVPAVKILGTSEVSKKLNIVGCRISKKAKEIVEKAGGSVK
ncbi:MAG: 50S ribosomal protein L15 [Parcubacteria group bacterium GW2011_GWF2_38_76]|nr:MAG: 50S ribosomal protein L15 [Parcubacteria group bacterium GW2011_GWF2_38_76]HBM45897.1 50S ribosomal protein L15 [Patescibacteria group bacterium]